MLPLVTHPDYSFPFPENHRFAMEKFRRLHAHLVVKGIATRQNTFRPGVSKTELLGLAHDHNYLVRFMENQLDEVELRRMGLPWSNDLVRRTLIEPHGTLLAGYLALEHGLACHLAGGTHHAHHDFGSGFCIVNDLAVASRALVTTERVSRILIFDCDVHQGDGTARILADEARVFTCSLHCVKNFPARKAQSDLDLELPVGMTDDAYLCAVRETLLSLIDTVRPELILYDAGVDVYAGDDLGYLDVTWDGIQERDRLVLETCLDAAIPVATVIGGGYDRDRVALARRHGICAETAFHIVQERTGRVAGK